MSALQLTGVPVLPHQHRLLITLKYALIKLRAGAYDEWIACLDVTPLPETQWTPAKPTFGASWGPWAMDEADVPQEKLEQGATWLQAMFDDPFLRLMNDKSTEAIVGQLSPLVRFLTENSCCFPPELQSYRDVALRVARGLLAILSPTPGFMGSGARDVEFIHQPAGCQMPAVVNEFPKMGRLIAGKLRRDEFWKGLVSEFRKFHGPGMDSGTKVVAAAEKAARLAHLKLGGDWTEALDVEWNDLLQELQGELVTWRAALRPRATDELETNSLKLIAKDVEDWGRGGRPIGRWVGLPAGPVGRSAGCSVGRSLGRSLGRTAASLSVGWPVGQCVGRPASWSVGRPVGRSAGGSVGGPLGRLLSWSVGRSVDRPVGRPAACSLGSLARPTAVARPLARSVGGLAAGTTQSLGRLAARPLAHSCDGSLARSLIPIPSLPNVSPSPRSSHTMLSCLAPPSLSPKPLPASWPDSGSLEYCPSVW